MEEEEEPKIYINNRTRSWAVVGRVGGVVTVLTKEQPSVESKVVPDWVKEAMKEEEGEEEGEGGEGEALKNNKPQVSSVPEQVSNRGGVLDASRKIIGFFKTDATKTLT